MRLPQLYLGLLGFDAAREHALRKMLAAHNQLALKNRDAPFGLQALWSIVNFREADALLVCGAGALSANQSELRFRNDATSLNDDAPIAIMLDQVSQPFAISESKRLTELGADLKSYPIFNLAVDTSLPWILRQFESILRPLRSLYALALGLTERRSELDPQCTYHLQLRGRLDAVVDLPCRRVLVRPGARPADLSDTTWERRPGSANFAPAHFLECTLAEITWLFAMHCPQIDLPPRYQNKPFWLRRNPDVRSSLLYPRHTVLLDRICDGPVSLGDLPSDLAIEPHLVKRDIYALFLIRAISTSGPLDDPLAAHSIPNEDQDDGKSMLNRMGQSMKTVTDKLRPLNYGMQVSTSYPNDR
jgi:hypothetical protein